MTDQQRDHLSVCRAEHSPECHLLSTQRHGMADDTVDADGGEGERERSQYSE